MDQKEDIFLLSIKRIVSKRKLLHLSHTNHYVSSNGETVISDGNFYKMFFPEKGSANIEKTRGSLSSPPPPQPYRQKMWGVARNLQKNTVNDQSIILS